MKTTVSRITLVFFYFWFYLAFPHLDFNNRLPGNWLFLPPQHLTRLLRLRFLRTQLKWSWGKIYNGTGA